MPRRLFEGAGVVLLVASVPAVGQTADEARTRALGQHLARECVTCHRSDGVDNGIPGIVGWKVDDFVETISFYRNRRRTNQAMVSVAESLDDEQVRALAIWFAAQPQPARKTPPVTPSKKK